MRQTMGQAMRPFRDRVLATVRRIPAGHVATYGDVASMAGAAGAARAVGTVMRKCGDGVTPCHRVVGAGGALGGYGGNLHMKRELLRREGVQVGVTRIRNFTAIRWVGTAAGRRLRRTPAR